MRVFLLSILPLLVQTFPLSNSLHRELEESDAQSLRWASEFNQLESLAQFALKATSNKVTSQQTGCTLKTLKIRRNWRAFSVDEKKAYIESVLCLQSLPSRTPPELARKNSIWWFRGHPYQSDHSYSSFSMLISLNPVLVYVFYLSITVSVLCFTDMRQGLFVAWHRYFIHEFELALQKECNYTGDYPWVFFGHRICLYMMIIKHWLLYRYWDWGADAESIEKSPVFDGSDTSLSRNGAYIPNQRGIRVPVGNYTPVFLPPGTGGGCVTSGPFINYTVNMGPSYLSTPGDRIVSRPFPLDHNPRCMKPDLTTAVLRRQVYLPYWSCKTWLRMDEISGVWFLTFGRIKILKLYIDSSPDTPQPRYLALWNSSPGDTW